MKRCPKCNRTYTTGTQKFCTHDGGILESVDIGQETIRIDSTKFDTDAPTKAISRELTQETTSNFDPFKTVISRPEGTVAPGKRDTQDISPPSTTLQPTPAPPTPPAPDLSEETLMRTMASIPPPPTSPPAPSTPQPIPPQLPTQRLVGSGPIASSAPLPSAPLPQSQPQPTPPPSAAKKSKLPLIFGILVLLLLLGIGGLGAAYFFVLRPMLAARKGDLVEPPQPPTNTPTPVVEASPNEAPKNTTAPEPPPYSPPADAVQFLNSIENLDGKLAEHYVDFSFYYPNSWKKDPTAGVSGASNFAKVSRELPPDFTQENFAVGWYSSAGSAEADRAVFPSLAQKISAQFEKNSKNFPEYQEVSKGETKAGVYEGYEFRFQAISRNTVNGDVKLWGRLVFLPPVDGGKNGVTLLMLATSLAPELKSVDDVGVKGELPMVLESFRFGKR
jgi:hypothetical protein